MMETGDGGEYDPASAYPDGLPEVWRWGQPGSLALSAKVTQCCIAVEGWPKSCKLAQDFECKSLLTASSWPNFWADPVTFTLCRFSLPLIHFMSDSLTCGRPCFLKRQRDRTPGGRQTRRPGRARSSARSRPPSAPRCAEPSEAFGRRFVYSIRDSPYIICSAASETLNDPTAHDPRRASRH
jgi:hypothetical protein